MNFIVNFSFCDGEMMKDQNAGDGSITKEKHDVERYQQSAEIRKIMIEDIVEQAEMHMMDL